MLLSLIIRMMDQLVLKCTVEDEPEVECDECLRDKPIETFCTDCIAYSYVMAVLTTTHMHTVNG